mmetsp:Transcript_1878/g.3099  ORF Transcript_1878/g.3099 Transcript_1878/m.3099 type:complete len:249 (-) Transcript_1878:165-911(-)
MRTMRTTTTRAMPSINAVAAVPAAVLVEVVRADDANAPMTNRATPNIVPRNTAAAVAAATTTSTTTTHELTAATDAHDLAPAAHTRRRRATRHVGAHALHRRRRRRHRRRNRRGATVRRHQAAAHRLWPRATMWRRCANRSRRSPRPFRAHSCRRRAARWVRRTCPWQVPLRHPPIRSRPRRRYLLLPLALLPPLLPLLQLLLGRRTARCLRGNSRLPPLFSPTPTLRPLPHYLLPPTFRSPTTLQKQ